MEEKFKVVFFINSFPQYGKIFKLDVNGIESAAFDMKMWKKGNTITNDCWIFPVDYLINYPKGMPKLVTKDTSIRKQ